MNHPLSQLGTSSAEGSRCYLLKPTNSSPYTQQLSCQTASSTGTSDPQHEKEAKYVTVSTTKVAKQPIAITDMSVRHVVAPLMDHHPAALPLRIEQVGKRPKYLQYHIWDPDSTVTETTPDWTKLAKPLPRPLTVQLMHPVLRETVAQNPSLFKIVTPINLKVFEDLLLSHPNRAFVKSVCNGLWYRFWPWADIWKPGYPDELDLSWPQIDQTCDEFLNTQRDHEVRKGQYSPSIGSTLLLGMYCMLIYAVPKPHSDKLRLVNDHSASKYSLNSMVDHSQVTGYPMDNLAQFREQLVKFQKGNLDLRGPDLLVVWKLDISEAYRVCPLHPFWQLKQGIQIGDNVDVDWCIVFESLASPAVFIVSTAWWLGSWDTFDTSPSLRLILMILLAVMERQCFVLHPLQ